MNTIFSCGKNFPQFPNYSPKKPLCHLLHLSIPTASGVHNWETLEMMRNADALPLKHAKWCSDLLQTTVKISLQNHKTDKAAPMRAIWTMPNKNLVQIYNPLEFITIDEQLFSYGLRNSGVVIQQAHIFSNDQLYTGKQPSDSPWQLNVGDITVLNLVAHYKGSGNHMTIDNFLKLIKWIKRWETIWHRTL